MSLALPFIPARYRSDIDSRPFDVRNDPEGLAQTVCEIESLLASSPADWRIITSEWSCRAVLASGRRVQLLPA